MRQYRHRAHRQLNYTGDDLSRGFFPLCDHGRKAGNRGMGHFRERVLGERLFEVALEQSMRAFLFFSC